MNIGSKDKLLDELNIHDDDIKVSDKKASQIVNFIEEVQEEVKKMSDDLKDTKYDFEKMIDRLDQLERSCNDMKDGYEDTRDRLKEYKLDL